MRNYLFSIRKRAIFRHGQEIKGLRGSVQRYAAQASPKIDAAMAEKGRFRMETRVYTLFAELDILFYTRPSSGVVFIENADGTRPCHDNDDP
jgi:hypothetical protein